MDGGALRDSLDVREMQVVSDHGVQDRLWRGHGYFVKQSPVSQTVSPAIVRREFLESATLQALYKALSGVNDGISNVIAIDSNCYPLTPFASSTKSRRP
jgi:hypothetical protein